MATRSRVRSRKVDAGNLELAGLTKQFEIHNKSDGKSHRTVEWYNEVLDIFMG